MADSCIACIGLDHLEQRAPLQTARAHRVICVALALTDDRVRGPSVCQLALRVWA